MILLSKSVKEKNYIPEHEEYSEECGNIIVERALLLY